MARGFPDWQRGVSVAVQIEDPDYPTSIATRPLAALTQVNAAATNTSSWTTIVSYTPIAGRRSYIAKAEAVVTKAHLFQVLKAGVVIGVGAAPDNGMYVDFWPFGQYFDGDGSHSWELQAKAVSTGGTVTGILVLEDVIT